MGEGKRPSVVPDTANDELACRAEILEMFAMRNRRCLPRPLAMIWAGCAIPAQTLMGANYEILIRNGTIYDGSGRAPIVGDVAIDGDTIAAIGKPGGARGNRELDAQRLAIAPGF